MILSLLTGTATILYFAPPVTSAVNPVAVYAVPTMLGSWSGVEGVPEEILPLDPNERASVRRTYRNGDRVAWVSVALFAGQAQAARQSSINKIFPERSVSRIEPVSFAAKLNGVAASSIALPAVIIHQDSRNLFVTYWHQIGAHVYGSEYDFRLALMRDMVLARRADSMLIRIATPLDLKAHLATDLTTVERLASELYTSLGGGGR